MMLISRKFHVNSSSIHEKRKKLYRAREDRRRDGSRDVQDSSIMLAGQHRLPRRKKQIPSIYTLCPKKVVHQTHDDNFVNS